jgi:hypothetical protein
VLCVCMSLYIPLKISHAACLFNLRILLI